MNPHRVKFALFVIAMVAVAFILLRLAPVVWSVIQILLLAVLIGIALEWVVEWQVAHRFPRWAATANLLIVLFLFLALLFYFLVPPLIAQFQQFMLTLPALWENALQRWGALVQRYPQLTNAIDVGDFISSLLQSLGSWTQMARTVFSSAVGGITGLILVLVLVFYALLDPWPLLYGLRGLFPFSWWSTLERVAGKSAMQIRRWVMGTLVLGVIIGAMDYLALFLINTFYPYDLPFILLFAILGGLLEVVPVIGPIIAAIIPATVGFLIDPILGILVLLSFFVIQQLENYLLVPLVMHRAVNLHPVSLIVALMVLSSLFGIFGAIIAVPVASVVKILYDDWYYPLLHDGHPPDPPLKKEPTAPPEDIVDA